VGVEAVAITRPRTFVTPVVPLLLFVLVTVLGCAVWQNLTMQMAMCRFTRLTNAFSKKVENVQHAVSLHFMYYNFCRIHKTLRVTPAMEAKLTQHVWTIEEIVELLG
jgi:hypothetical protein